MFVNFIKFCKNYKLVKPILKELSPTISYVSTLSINYNEKIIRIKKFIILAIILNTKITKMRCAA